MNWPNKLECYITLKLQRGKQSSLLHKIRGKLSAVNTVPDALVSLQTY
jgi:hypothetical protein